MAKFQQARKSSSTPASCKAQRSSFSALTHGRKSSAAVLVPREGSIEHGRSGERKRGKRRRTGRRRLGLFSE